MTGAEMRAWRRSLGWSQWLAAEAIGVCRRSVQAYEASAAPIPLYIVLATEALTARHQVRAAALSAEPDHAG